MKSILIASAAMLLTGAGASAETPLDYEWAEAPDHKRFMAAIPAAAKKVEQDGRVLLDCAVASDGSLSGCTAKEETPAGVGYAAAAVALAREYRLDRRVRGQQALARVTFPLRFRPTFSPPNWVRRPKSEDLAAVWPAEAMRRGISGRAVIRCGISTEGTLRKCAVREESPEGTGFGAAALALAPTFLMKPPMNRGRLIEGEFVNIPVNFETEGGGYTGKTFVSLNSPLWVAAPTSAEVAAACPRKPKGQGLTGLAALDCEVTQEGALKGCRVATESPEGRGFGRAAVSLASKFKVEPPGPAPDNRKIMVRVPVTFSPGDAEGRQIAKPEWGRLPLAEQVVYPPKAKAAKVNGSAVLACTVAAGGQLQGCTVAKETPAGMGFGEAALGLAPHFRMKAWTSDGRPVDGAKVRIPVSYQDPE
ncbi:MAG TPA: TonB family protein [Caulobacteraceae bacterium]|jgi:TonB family protein